MSQTVPLGLTSDPLGLTLGPLGVDNTDVVDWGDVIDSLGSEDGSVDGIVDDDGNDDGIDDGDIDPSSSSSSSPPLPLPVPPPQTAQTVLTAEVTRWPAPSKVTPLSL